MERPVYLLEMLVGDVRVYLCCGNVGMTEKRLHRSEICAVFEKIGRK